MNMQHIDVTAMDNKRTALLVFFALALANLYDNVLLGPYGMVDFNDCFGADMIYYAMKGNLFREFGAYTWFPWYSGGIPSFVSHHQPYYPLAWVSPFVPGWAIFLLWKTSQIALAGYGMQRLLRDWFRLTSVTAFVGALVFALLQRNVTYHYVFAYAFPLFFLWSQELLEQSLTFWGRLVRVLGMIFWAMLSYPVLTLPYFSSLHVVMILFFARSRGGLVRRLIQALVIWIGVILLFSPNLGSYLSYLPYHHRVFHNSYNGFSDALQITLGTLRGFLGFYPATAIVLYCIPELSKNSRLWKSVALLATTLVVASVFFSPFKYAGIVYYLRFMDLYNFQSIQPLAYAMCAAFGFEQLQKAEKFPSILRIVLCITPFTLFFSSYVIIQQIFGLAAFLGLLALVRLRDGRDVYSHRVMVAVLTCFAVGLSGVWMIGRQRVLHEGRVPFIKAYEHDPGLTALSIESSSKRLEPFRVASLDVQSSIAKSYGLDTVDNYNVLFDKNFHRYVMEIVDPQMRTEAMRERFRLEHTLLYLTAVDPTTFRTEDLRWEYWRSRTAAEWKLGLMAAMNVKYLIASQPVQGIDKWADVVQEGHIRHVPWNLFNVRGIDEFYSFPLWIYRLKDRQPLGYAVPKVRYFMDQDALLHAMSNAEPDELASTAFLLESERVSVGELDGTAGQAVVRLSSWRPDKLRYEISTSREMLFVVANNMHQGWKATLDGAHIDLVRVNGAFQGIKLQDPGKHILELRFEDKVIGWMYLLAGFGVCMLAASAYIRLKSIKFPASESPFLSTDSALCFETSQSQRILLLSSLATGIAWCIFYFVFEVLKHPNSTRPLVYTLVTMPPIPVLLSFWGGRALKAIGLIR